MILECHFTEPEIRQKKNQKKPQYFLRKPNESVNNQNVQHEDEISL